MRDFTCSNYCDVLWINDLLSLQRTERKKDYVAHVQKSNKKYLISFQYVTIFGSIVEVRHIGDKGFLYSVDDGTGVIQCKHTNEQFLDIVDLIENERDKLHESVISTRSVNESTKCEVDDTIFNDKTFQKDELGTLKKDQLLGFQSLWGNVLENFECLVHEFNVGDTVYVQGKLYDYFHRNQIYINSIRRMDLHEELLRIRIKLESGYEPLQKVEENEPNTETDVNETKRISKRKFSGIITFDHIPHTEMKVPPNKYLTPKRKSDGEDDFNPKKRHSIVSPCLEGAITFDTNYNDESMEMDDM